ncbi:hypothetical protein GGS23DRAFT_615488 [Durotheca rogersii]|uniref:uncharacterized protein n=1 Tax=Durotheca rogersii TaxID=419775 RepID=UPI00221E5614|nr:uncharacterized protein GGS23DRAFT_615488 [Durotheca rogersii]KAI5866857.1 hypothetical protein GGS23DRAFT_615488 [Durotheca rogersii]
MLTPFVLGSLPNAANQNSAPPKSSTTSRVETRSAYPPRSQHLPPLEHSDAVAAAPDPPATATSDTQRRRATLGVRTELCPPPYPNAARPPRATPPIPYDREAGRQYGMPSLTLNTGQAAAGSSSHGPPAPQPSSIPSSATNPPAPAPAARAPAPTPPQPSAQTPSRPSSPARPSYSPITPPLNPVSSLPAGAGAPRPTYTHAAGRAEHAAAAAPPPPAPLDFAANPDVLALKSAISILQLQRRKAESDMAALQRVKAAALARPDAFVRDLVAGRVRAEGDRLFPAPAARPGDGGGDGDGDSDSSSSSSSSSGAASTRSRPAPSGLDPVAGGPETSGAARKRKPEKPKGKGKERTKRRSPADSEPAPPWATLPKPQNVVRCPPINWSQYAVVGESLDRLHAEQLSSPSQGGPAVLTPDGQYDFSAGAGNVGVRGGRQEKLIGIAAPYLPGRDKLDKKPKASRR